VTDIDLIDEAGFIQALTLLAITHNIDIIHEEQEQRQDDEEANAEIEDDGAVDGEMDNTHAKIRKVLQLMERIADSEQIHTRRNKLPGSSMKIVNVLIKTDFLDPFKRRYPWYFRAELERLKTPKPKTF